MFNFLVKTLIKKIILIILKRFVIKTIVKKGTIKDACSFVKWLFFNIQLFWAEWFLHAVTPNAQGLTWKAISEM